MNRLWQDRTRTEIVRTTTTAIRTVTHPTLITPETISIYKASIPDQAALTTGRLRVMSGSEVLVR